MSIRGRSKERGAIPKFYRIVPYSEVTADDFLSHQAKGLPAGRKAREEGWWVGVSAYDSLLVACRLAVDRNYRHGRFIAELLVEETSTITFKQTTSVAEHYTLWGTPADLLRCVQWVQAAERCAGLM
jgi:hypothetical protein